MADDCDELPFVFKERLPFAIQYDICKPSYYIDQDNIEFILIVLTGHDPLNAIIKYALNSDMKTEAYAYNDILVNIIMPGQLYIKEHQKLYTFSVANTHQIISFDVNTHKIDIHSTYKSGSAFPKAVQLPNPWNIIYIYDHPNHFKSDRHLQNIETLNYPFPNDIVIEYPKLIWIESLNKLMMIGSAYFHYIWECAIDKTDLKFEWKQYELVMPYTDEIAPEAYDIVLAFEHIIFVFYFAKYWSVWCLDLMHTQWFRSEYNVPNCFKSDENVFVIKDGQNNAHLFDFGQQIHCTVSLYDLIPKQLDIVYRKNNQILMCAYLKQYESGIIPSPLQTLIGKYYPVFL